MQTKDRLSPSRHVSESDGAKKDVCKKFIPGDIKFIFGKNVQFVLLRVLYMIPWIKIRIVLR